MAPTTNNPKSTTSQSSDPSPDTHDNTTKVSLAKYRSLPIDIRSAGLPEAIAELGPEASYAFIEFFVANIRNVCV